MAKRNDPENSQNASVTAEVAPRTSSAPDYLLRALQLSSSYPLGAPNVDVSMLGDTALYAKPGNNVGIVATSDTEPIPGIMALSYIPTLGCSFDEESPLNRALYQQFNAIRRHIQGNRPYAPVDHMIYRMCVDNIRDLYHYVRRIYGVVQTYTATNLYRPKAILTAMGLNADDWVAHADELYTWLLTHRGSLKDYPTIPIGHITDRHNLYNTVFFTDGDAPTAQTYIMNQTAFYSYEKVDQVKGATLRSMPETFDEFVELWKVMYSALVNSSDVYLIAADIRTAFGDNVITDLPSTPVEMEVEYVKLDPVLTSIMNATVLPVPVKSYDKFRIYDDNGTLKCTPDYSWSSVTDPATALWDYVPVAAKYSHLNMVSPNPSGEDILNATRLRPLAKLKTLLPGIPEGEEFTPGAIHFGQRVTLKAMATEVVTIIRVGGNIQNSKGWIYGSGVYMPYSTLNAEDGRQKSRVLHAMAALSKFDWHPPVSVFVADEKYTSLEHGGTFEDVQNLVPISDVQLENIINASILYEFGMTD